MLAHLALKLKDYIHYFVLADIVLICLAIMMGAFLLLRRFLNKQPFEGDPAFDNERIATEINDEIGRLEDLRNRVFPKLQGASRMTQSPAFSPEAAAAVVAQTSEPSAALEGPNAAQMAADIAAAEARAELKFQGRLDELKAELEKAMAELEKAKTAAPAAASSPSAGGSANEAELKAQVEKVRNEIEQKAAKEKEELATKVVHLEKVVSEYRIFEEDFALVKRYKAENEKLKKQMTTEHQVTEDDINKLFGSLDASAEATTTIPAAESEDSFFKDAFPAMSAAAPAEPTPAPAQAAPEPTPTAPATPANAELEAMLAAASKAEPAVEAAPVAETAAPDATFDVEKVNSEPVLNVQKSAEMEDLAESAVADDKLLEEFQKILGDKAS